MFNSILDSMPCSVINYAPDGDFPIKKIPSLRSETSDHTIARYETLMRLNKWDWVYKPKLLFCPVNSIPGLTKDTYFILDGDHRLQAFKNYYKSLGDFLVNNIDPKTVVMPCDVYYPEPGFFKEKSKSQFFFDLFNMSYVFNNKNGLPPTQDDYWSHLGVIHDQLLLQSGLTKVVPSKIASNWADRVSLFNHYCDKVKILVQKGTEFISVPFYTCNPSAIVAYYYSIPLEQVPRDSDFTALVSSYQRLCISSFFFVPGECVKLVDIVKVGEKNSSKFETVYKKYEPMLNLYFCVPTNRDFKKDQFTLASASKFDSRKYRISYNHIVNLVFEFPDTQQIRNYLLSLTSSSDEPTENKNEPQAPTQEDGLTNPDLLTAKLTSFGVNIFAETISTLAAIESRPKEEQEKLAAILFDPAFKDSPFNPFYVVNELLQQSDAKQISFSSLIDLNRDSMSQYTLDLINSLVD